jgi:hypothetical protein
MEWISVKDRLPPMPDSVLFINKYGDMGVSCIEELERRYCVEWGDAGMLPIDMFTHWMPLPDPPDLLKE